MFAKVDKFIDDLESKRKGFTPDAQNREIYEVVQGRFGKKSKRVRGEFLNILGTAITNYQSTINPVMRWEYAKECLRYIEWSYSWNIIVDLDVERRLKSLEEENKQLKEIKLQLEQKIEDQRKLLEACNVTEFSIAGDDEQ